MPINLRNMLRKFKMWEPKTYLKMYFVAPFTGQPEIKLPDHLLKWDDELDVYIRNWDNTEDEYGYPFELDENVITNDIEFFDTQKNWPTTKLPFDVCTAKNI